ncbi:MAG TPA: NADPH:quinone reductase [Actinomycetes bacterium]|nr:NADPH:quinone reductase [Actinomycetes bacterium]
MKAIIYSRTGGPDVLELVDRPTPDPGAGEVRVRISVSGVNPTDWKVRRGSAPDQPLAVPEQVPGQDGAGVVDAVGSGVDGLTVGQRVWLWESAFGRAAGTTAEYVVLPAAHVVPLPEGASLDLGASLGIPAITAHRCLTMAEGVPARLAPGALAGRTVLVAGGAGAVGHAAIELARWAGATVVATVSSPAKAALASAAGAHHVVDYRAGDPAAAIREVAPDGVDIVVEVAVAANAELDRAVLATNGAVVAYGGAPGDAVNVPVRDLMVANTRLQFVLVYTMPAAAKREAVAAVSAAVEAGALRVGEEAGLPLHRFPLERAADAHAAVAAGAVGKVLIDIA